MDIKYGSLASPSFITSFKRLMSVSEIGIKDKMQLVAMRKEFEGTLSILREAIENKEQNAINDFMEATGTYLFGRIKLTDDIGKHLSADDIFNLEPLLEA